MAAKCCKTWDVAELTGTKRQEVLAKLDRSVFKQDGINAPIAMARDGGQLYIANHYEKIYAFSNDLDINYHLPIDYQEPNTSNNGIAYSFGLDFDSASNKVAVCSWSRHVARVYNKLTGELLYQIGEYNSAGNAADDKLFYPRNPLWLPSGNLLICSFRGTGLNGTAAYGHVTEYDGTTGTIIDSWLNYSSSTGISHLSKDVIRYPIKILLDPKDSNFLWVSEYYRGRLLKFDLTTKTIVDQIVAPIGYNLNLAWSFCFLSDGSIAIIAQRAGLIIIIEPISKKVISALDPGQFGVSRNLRDVIEIEPGYLAVSTWSDVDSIDRAVHILPTTNQIELDYSLPEIPPDYEIATDQLPSNFNPSTSKALVDKSCLSQVPEKIIIPFRAVC